MTENSQSNSKDSDQLYMALDWRIRALKLKIKEEVSSANSATKSDDVDSTTDDNSPTKRLKLENSCEADTSTANNSEQTSSSQ